MITLWFDHVSNRNFFYSFLENATGQTQNTNNYTYNEILKPRTIGVYLKNSGKDFAVLNTWDESYDYNTVYLEGKSIIEEALSRGGLVRVMDSDDLLWQQRGIVFQYGIDFNYDILLGDIGVDSEVANKIEGVRTIGIIVAGETDEMVRVYLIDDEHHIYLFEISKDLVKSQNNQLLQSLSKISEVNSISYESTFKNDIELFKNNVLYPLIGQQDTFKQQVIYQYPYVINGFIESGSLENYINNYFENPDVKWKTENSSTVIYGDDNAMIKYTNMGLFEYTSTNKGKETKNTVSKAYNIAASFLDKDKLLKENEYYLKDVIIEEEQITFYYNYMHNDIPVIIDELWLGENGLTTAIELTVSGNKVIRYTRILLLASDIEIPKTRFNQPFNVVLDEFVNEHDVKAREIEDMYLSYYLDEGLLAEMKWVVEYQGDEYIIK